MWRWLRLTFGVLSLLLCAGCVAAWVRSYRQCDRFDAETHTPPGLYEVHRHLNVRSGKGGLMVFLNSYEILRRPDDLKNLGRSSRPARAFVHRLEKPWYPMLSSTATSYPGAISGLGFQFVQERKGGELPASVIRSVTMPWAVPVMLTAALPGWMAMRRLRRRRRQEGKFCVGCGYDLRASTERCPECGLAMPGLPGTPA